MIKNLNHRNTCYILNSALLYYDNNLLAYEKESWGFIMDRSNSYVGMGFGRKIITLSNGWPNPKFNFSMSTDLKEIGCYNKIRY